MEYTYKYSWIIPFIPLPVPMLIGAGLLLFPTATKSMAGFGPFENTSVSEDPTTPTISLSSTPLNLQELVTSTVFDGYTGIQNTDRYTDKVENLFSFCF